MRKKLSKSEFACYLLGLEFNEKGQCPFVDNYFASKVSSDSKNMYMFLFFLKMELEDYKNLVRHGEINFQEFLNNRYPPVDINSDSSLLDELDSRLREQFLEDDTLTVGHILEIIDDIKNHPEG